MIFSCSDDVDDNREPDIVGEWKLVEIYDGYVHGGNFTWTAVPNTYSKIIRFTSDGQYFEDINSEGTQRECTGTYRLLPDNRLEIESSCQTVLVHREMELTHRTLIFNIQVIEGVIKEKYSLINPK